MLSGKKTSLILATVILTSASQASLAVTADDVICTGCVNSTDLGANVVTFFVYFALNGVIFFLVLNFFQSISLSLEKELA